MKDDGLHLQPPHHHPPHRQANASTNTQTHPHKPAATLTRTNMSRFVWDRNPSWWLHLLHIFYTSCLHWVVIWDCSSVTGEVVCIPEVSDDVCMELLWWDKGCPGARSVTSAGNQRNKSILNNNLYAECWDGSDLRWHLVEWCCVKSVSCLRASQQLCSWLSWWSSVITNVHPREKQ